MNRNQAMDEILRLRKECLDNFREAPMNKVAVIDYLKDKFKIMELDLVEHEKTKHIQM